MQQRFVLQILLLAQHVSGTTMPIIRSSRVLYSGCCLWYFVLWFFKLLVWCGAKGYVSGLQDEKTHSTKYHRQQPLYNTLELLMMGIVLKRVEQAIRSAIKPLLHLIGILFPHINVKITSNFRLALRLETICLMSEG